MPLLEARIAVLPVHMRMQRIIVHLPVDHEDALGARQPVTDHVQGRDGLVELLLGDLAGGQRRLA